MDDATPISVDGLYDDKLWDNFLSEAQTSYNILKKFKITANSVLGWIRLFDEEITKRSDPEPLLRNLQIAFRVARWLDRGLTPGKHSKELLSTVVTIGMSWLKRDSLSPKFVKALYHLVLIVRRVARIKDMSFMDAETFEFLNGVLMKLSNWRSLVKPCMVVRAAIVQRHEVTSSRTWTQDQELALVFRLIRESRHCRGLFSILIKYITDMQCYQKFITDDVEANLKMCCTILHKLQSRKDRKINVGALRDMLDIMNQCLVKARVSTLSEIENPMLLAHKGLDCVLELTSVSKQYAHDVPQLGLLFFEVLMKLVKKDSYFPYENLDRLMRTVTRFAEVYCEHGSPITQPTSYWVFLLEICRKHANSDLRTCILQCNTAHWVLKLARMVRDYSTASVLLRTFETEDTVAENLNIDYVIRTYFAKDVPTLIELCELLSASSISLDIQHLTTLADLFRLDNPSLSDVVCKALCTVRMNTSNFPIYKDYVMKELLAYHQRKPVDSNIMPYRRAEFLSKFFSLLPKESRPQYYQKKKEESTTILSSDDQPTMQLLPLDILCATFEYLDIRVVGKLQRVCKYFKLAASKIRHLSISHYNHQKCITVACSLFKLFPHVCSISISGSHLDYFLCLFIFTSPQLVLDQITTLNISSLAYLDAIPKAMHDISLLTNLQRLTIRDTPGKIALNLSATTSLRCLEIPGQAISTIQLQHIVSAYPNLKQLNLQGAKLESYVPLQNLRCLSRLEATYARSQYINLPTTKVSQGGCHSIQTDGISLVWNFKGNGFYFTANNEVRFFPCDSHDISTVVKFAPRAQLDLSPDGKFLLLVERQVVHIINTLDSKLLTSIALPFDQFQPRFVPLWISNTEYLICNPPLGNMIRYDIVQGQKERLQMPCIALNYVDFLTYLPDSKKIILQFSNQHYSTPDTHVFLWNLHDSVNHINRRVLSVATSEAEQIALLHSSFVEIHKDDKLVYKWYLPGSYRFLSLSFLSETKLIFFSTNCFCTLDWTHNTPIWSNATYFPGDTHRTVKLSPDKKHALVITPKEVTLLDLTVSGITL